MFKASWALVGGERLRVQRAWDFGLKASGLLTSCLAGCRVL